MNIKKPKIIIVEGKNDELRIKQILPDARVLKTNGSAVDTKFLDMVKELAKHSEIILFLDPDYNGEKIRKKIASICPSASHIFINKEDAISKNKKKIGVEHISLVRLKGVLEDVKSYNYNQNITIMDLYDLGLAGSMLSKIKRKKLCDDLNIGYVNAKGLAERLNIFNYSLSDVKELI